MFSRRQQEPTAAGPATGANVATHETKHHGKGPMFLSMNKRPSFGQWLKVTWLDILTMAAMGAVGLGVYEAHPAPSRSFPVYFQDGEIVYPQFAYVSILLFNYRQQIIWQTKSNIHSFSLSAMKSFLSGKPHSSPLSSPSPPSSLSKSASDLSGI